MIYLDLFIGFLKVGLFSFGGAYAAIPLIRDVVLSYGWLDEEAIAYMIAVSESTPGPIMVNLATFVGSTQGGVLGSALATLAVILPAFVIIIVLTSLLKNFIENKYVKAVLGGLTPCVIGIVLAMGITMLVNNVLAAGTSFALDLRAVITTAVLAAVMYGSKPILKKFNKKMSPILFIVIAAVVGLVIYAF